MVTESTKYWYEPITNHVLQFNIKYIINTVNYPISLTTAVVKLENRICRQIQDLLPIFGIKERRKHRGCSRSCTLPSTPGGWNWANFWCTMCVRVAVSEILADFINFHIWAWNLEFEERSQSWICTLILLHGVKIKLIFALRAAVFKIWADFQNSHIWAWNLEFEKSAGSCIWAIFLSQGVEIELIFALRAAVSEVRADFQNCHIWEWNLEFEKNAGNSICTFFLRQGIEIGLILPVQTVVFEMWQFKVLISLIN